MKSKVMKEYVKKPTYNSKKKKTQPKMLVSFQEEMDQRLGIRVKPPNEDYFRHLGDEFVEWCLETRTERGRKERRISLERYLEEKRIIPQTLDRWRKKSHYLENCIQFGKLILGNRLEEGLVYKELSEKAVMKMMYHYIPRWKQHDQYDDDRKKEVTEILTALGRTIDPGALDDSNKSTADRDTDKA